MLGRFLGVALLATTVGVVIPASMADAHGGPPNTRRLAFHPTDEDTIFAQATFGLLVSEDRGVSWRVVCEEAIGWQTTENPTIQATTSGPVVLGLFKGLYRTETFCGADLSLAELENVPIIDTDNDPTDRTRLIAATSLGSFENRVYVSEDDGETWTPSAGRFPEGDLPEGVRVAPSMPERLYLAGVRLEPRTGFFARSDDSGGMWTSVDVPLLGATTLLLGAVDPTDPLRVLVWRHYVDEPDALMLTEDGGETWDDVASVSGDLSAVAFSQDGSRVWYGGEDKGLHASDDGGRTWSPVLTDLAVRCLASRGDELWVCADNFADGFAVGVSTNGGETFEPRLVYRQLTGQVECGAGTRSAEVCPVAWRAIQDLFGLDAGPRPDGGTGEPDGDAPEADAAMNADAGSGDRSEDDCDCAVPGARGAARWTASAWAWIGLVMVVVWRRARRRGRREE
ncbi:MAG: hypothetical protein IT379_40090 [Deltaproteobacteria bacterium]|nr:hypothetical protein [Deltaproteobacteria bacterium]